MQNWMASSHPLMAGQEVWPLAGTMAFTCAKERVQTWWEIGLCLIWQIRLTRRTRGIFLCLHHSSSSVDMILDTFCSFLPAPLSHSLWRHSSFSARLSHSLEGLSSFPGLSCSAGRVASSSAQPFYCATRSSSLSKFSNPMSGLSHHLCAPS